MQNIHSVLFSSLLTAAAVAQAPIVSPNDRTTLEGSSFTHLPLGRANARMQTLHADVPGGTVISGHAYRREAAGVYGQVGGFASDLRVTLSMSPNAPVQATTVFAQNAGSNPVLVLPRTVVAFPPTNRPAVDPAANFEHVVPYQTAFVVPPQGGTVCIDIEVFGNTTPGGPDRNFSCYLDGHQNYANGNAEQPGYRFGTGCAAPGQTATTYGSLSLWHLGSQMQIDLSLRNGVAETGSGLARVWLAMGLQPSTQTWPALPQCTLFGSADIWFVMPGLPNNQGEYDGQLTALPVLPPGYRLWCQTGSAHLGNGALSFGDGVTVMTPPPGPLPIPTVRIVNSNDHTATTGTISYAVPVMLLF